MFLNYFKMLILKIIFFKKNIILIYFKIKNILKNNHHHFFKQNFKLIFLQFHCINIKN